MHVLEAVVQVLGPLHVKMQHTAQPQDQGNCDDTDDLAKALWELSQVTSAKSEHGD